MTDPAALLAASALALLATAAASLALLKGWNGWLALKRLEIEAPGRASRGGRELADLQERLRRLEAIASGLDGGA